MFNIPEKYRVDVDINMKDFVPKELKQEQKRRIREIMKKVTLAYQIAGEEIPSVQDEEYRCQVIQFYDMEISNIKEAGFIAKIYQEKIKSLCVLRLHDAAKETYSFAVKRLNQQDDTQVVIETSIITDCFQIGLPGTKRERLLRYITYENVCNKTNKLNFYKEIYGKVYMLTNEKAYANMQNILDSNIWYDARRAERIFGYYKGLVEQRGKLKMIVANADKVALNKEIKDSIRAVDEEIIGK